jgi:hypothetical protein
VTDKRGQNGTYFDALDAKVKLGRRVQDYADHLPSPFNYLSDLRVIGRANHFLDGWRTYFLVGLENP